MLQEVLEQKPSGQAKQDGVIAGVKVQYADASEQRKLTFVLNKLKKIPTGRQALENLAEYGTTVYLSRMGAWGAYNLQNNVIALSADAKNDKLCSTLVHEARHATQCHRAQDKTLTRLDYDPETQIRLDRAMEADAQVFAYQAVQEWSKAGNSKPFQEFYKSTPVTHNYYWVRQKREGFQNGTDEARKVLFEAFFREEDRVAGYENAYMNKQALSVMAQCVQGKDVDQKNCGSVHLTTEQIAAMTCGDYMDDTFLRSDVLVRLTRTTRDVLAIVSAVQGLDTGVEKFPVSDRLISSLDANDIACSSVGWIRRNAARVWGKNLNLTETALFDSYNAPVEKQAEIVKDFGAQEREAFRSGKVAERFVRYFRNLADISMAEFDGRTINKEEKQFSARKIIEEKTAENNELRDYVTVAAFVAHHRAKSPVLAEKALALPELSEGVKKELHFDDVFLAQSSEKSSQSLTKEDEKALAVLRKSLSRAGRDNALVLSKAAAKTAGR